MRWTLITKIVFDAILVNIGYVLAFIIRFGGVFPSVNWEAYWTTAPWITLAALILFYVYGLYNHSRQPWEEIFVSLLCSIAILFLVSIALSFMLRQFAFPRSVFLIAALLQLVLLSLWRYFVWKWSKSRIGPLKLVVVGSLKEAKKRAQQLRQDSGDMYQVVGLIVDALGENENNFKDDLPILGSYTNTKITEAIEGKDISGMLFCDDIPQKTKEVMVYEASVRGLSIFTIPNIYEILIAQSKLEQLDGIPVFRIAAMDSKTSFAWKRLIDIVLVLIFAVPAIPLLLMAAIALKLESPSYPILYRQERIGEGGKTFQLLKLRTMVPDAEKASGPVLATKNDPRITKVGHALRLTRIDELPQLWNVLKGDMSFVGPRPERPFFVEQFRKEIVGYDLRHRVKGGITGLAQIEGKYSTSAEDKLRYDLFYAGSKSIVKDLYILLHTLKVMLIRDKAS